MSEKVRHFLALVALFGGGTLIWLWSEAIGFGVYGLGFSMIGLTVFWLVFGISSGYWIGLDPRRDVMVMELMKRTKERLAAEDDPAE